MDLANKLNIVDLKQKLLNIVISIQSENDNTYGNDQILDDLNYFIQELDNLESKIGSQLAYREELARDLTHSRLKDAKDEGMLSVILSCLDSGIPLNKLVKHTPYSIEELRWMLKRETNGTENYSILDNLTKKEREKLNDLKQALMDALTEKEVKYYEKEIQVLLDEVEQRLKK